MSAWFPTFRRILHKRLPAPNWSPRGATVTQRRALLRLIAVATEENLPLSPLLEAWSTDERRGQRHRLERLVELIKGGTSLPDAVEQVHGVLRDEDLLAIRFDSQLGTRTAAIRETLDDDWRAPTDRQSPGRRNAAYFGVVLVLSFLVVLFIHIRVSPDLELILEEFNLDVPQTVRFSNSLFGLIAGYWWLGAIALLVALWTMFAATPGRFLRSTILGRFISRYHEPLAADVLDKLRIATSVGRPIPGVLSTLARYHFDATFRHKLLFVRNEVEQGVDVWHSMSVVKLLTLPEVRVLHTADRVGNRAWALQQLSAVKQRRALRKRERLGNLLLPVVVLAMGAFVLFQALTVFMPLTEILRSLL